MNQRTHIIGLILLLTYTAWGGPLDTQQISSSANWVIHLNSQAFLASEFGTQLMAMVDSNEVQAKLKAFKILTGSNLKSDIHSLTLFGPDHNETKVVFLVKGNFKPNKLLAMLVLTPGYEKMIHGDHEIHKWRPQEQIPKIHFLTLSEHLLAISQSKASLETALDVLSGQAENAQGANRFSALKRVPENAFLVACAEELSKLTQGQANAAMFQKSSMVAFVAGEEEGCFTTSLQLETESPEVANQMQLMGRGILAMVQMQKSELPQINTLIQACTLKAQDKVLEVAFKFPLDKLMPILKSQAHKLKQFLG